MAFRELTHGSIPRLILVLAWPVFGSFVLQSLYALADLFFVGLLGGAPLGGLGIALNAFFLVLALGQSIGIGTLAVLSRSYGSGDLSRVRLFYRQSMLLVLVLGSLCWWAGYLSTDLYFSVQTEDPDVYREGSVYFRIYVATFLFQMFLMVNGYARRALGDFITPTLLMGLSVLINLALDPLLIFGWGPVPAMGIRGAAWATVFSQVISGGVYLVLMVGSRRNRHLFLVGVPKPDWRVLGEILRIGVPSGGQFVLFSLMNLIMFSYVKPFGADATAAVAVGFRIIHSAILPAVAICAAVSSVVGQNYGARNWPRMRAGVGWGALYCFCLLGVEYLVLAAMPGFWIGLFSDEPGVISAGSDYLLISGAAVPLFSLGMAIIFGLQGMGRTIIPLVAMSARFSGFILTLLLLSAFTSLSLQDVMWANALAMVLESVFMMVVATWMVRGFNREFQAPPVRLETLPDAHWHEDLP